MKKIIILIVFFFNLIPHIEKGTFTFSGPVSVLAQYGGEYDSSGFYIIDGNVPDEGSGVQYGNLCVPMTMEYIGEYYGMNLNQFDIAAEYALQQNMELNDVVLDGVLVSHLEGLIGNYFDYNVLAYSDDIIGAIDSGHPVMGTYDTGSGLHEVMIWGYDFEDGQIQYLDPATGNYDTRDSSDFIILIEVLPP